MKNSVNNNIVLSTAATIATIALSANFASAGVIYDNVPAVLPGNVASQGYQATSTSELGNGVQFAFTERDLTTITVGLSDWATPTDFPALFLADSTGWDHPITVNVYTVGGTPGAVGSLIASKTEAVHVPWHTFNGFNGTLFTAPFDFTGTTVPDSAIITVAFNTQNYGSSPIGIAGPYNSLNLAFSTTPSPIGGDLDVDDAYWNSTYGGRAPGLAVDTGWAPYSPMMQVVAVPEPTSIALIGLGAAALLRRRRSM